LRVNKFNNKNEIHKLFDDSAKIILKSKSLSSKIENSIKIILDTLNTKKKIVIMGNGGSAADAQHMAAEFIGRYLLERKSIPAISLATDSSILTAIGNDYGFEKSFSRQCEALVEKNDTVIVISTSGNSKNILEALKICKKKGAKTIGLTGKSGGKLKEKVDLLIQVPSIHTPRIQEGHRIIIHAICEIVEKQISNQQ
jgi:D-sedoheptulose 7-phosphate isomerase